MEGDGTKDEKSLEVAAFRVWSQNSEVGRVEREIVGSTWNSSFERSTTIFERFRWVSTKFDAESGTVLTRWRSVWADRSGAKKVFANRPSELEVRNLLWEDLHAPALLDQNDARTLRLRARAIWDDVVAVFHDRLLQGDIRVFGRVGLMTNPSVSEIPAAAWHHFTIDDWGKRTAKSDDGQRLFDLHVGAPPNPVGRRGKVGPVARIIAELYPDRDYPSDKDMLKAIKARTGEALSARTLSRAKRAARDTP